MDANPFYMYLKVSLSTQFPDHEHVHHVFHMEQL